MATKEIKLDGIAYQVMYAHTPETREAEGQTRLAQHMRGYNIAKDTLLLHPNGRDIYRILTSTDGSVGRPQRLF